MTMLEEQRIDTIVVDEAILSKLIQFIRERCDLMLSQMKHADRECIITNLKNMVQAANQKNKPIFFLHTLKKTRKIKRKIRFKPKIELMDVVQSGK